MTIADRQIEQAAITRNRFRKAARIADALQRAGASADQVPMLNEATWKVAEAQAGCKSSSLVTRALVEEILRDREVER